MKNYQIIAHRGASAYAPENTIAAFRKAHDLGAQWVEFDVILSHDEVPVIFHDETTTRTTNLADKKIVDLSLAQIKELDAGSWFSAEFAHEKIPTLAETFQFLQEHTMQAHVELKTNPGKEEKTVILALEQLNHYWPKDAALPIFSSFDIEMLRTLRKHHASLPLALAHRLWNNYDMDILQELHCTSMHLNANFITREQIMTIQKQGFKVLCYTVDALEQAQRLFDWGINGIFTNYPDRFNSLL